MSVPSAETRELKTATDALSRGAFHRAAAAYARAARLRARRSPADLDLYQRSIVLSLAAGDRKTARATLERLRRQSSRWGRLDRVWIESRLGDLWFEEGREPRAQTHYRAALESLPRRHPQRPALHLQVARAALRSAQLRVAMRHALAAEQEAEPLDDHKATAEALLLQARIETHYETASAFLLSFEEAASLAHEEGLRAVEREARQRWAEVLLALGREDDALRQAEAAHRLAVMLRDPGAAGAATRLVAATYTALAERTEGEQGRGTAGGLRREAAHRLRTALASARRGVPPAELGMTLLWAARLAALESPGRTQRLVGEAAPLLERAGLERLALEAQTLGLEARPRHPKQAAAWRRLARRAEGVACGEIAATAWRAAAGNAIEHPGEGTTLGAERSLRRAYSWEPGLGPWIPAPLDPVRRTPEKWASDRLAEAALRREPEPKRETFSWVLAKRAHEAQGRGTPLERLRPLAFDDPTATYAADLMARRERVLETQVQLAPPARRSALWSNQLAFVRQRGSGGLASQPPAPPRLRAPESLVVFARLGDSVEGFCLSPKGVLFHAPTMPTEKWTAWALRLRREAREARGWPDGAVPEPLTNRARRTLRDLGREIWAPLWPSLVGTTRVLLLPDPALPLLPFAALLLAAESVAWRQPLALSHLVAAPVARGRRWKGKLDALLAIAPSGADSELATREARSAARVFGGRVLSGDRLLRAPDVARGPNPSPRDQLREARALYLAAPLRGAAVDGFTVSVRLGDNEAALGEVLRETPRLDLLLAPDLELVSAHTSAVGRVVGSIDTQGAHAVRTPRSPSGLAPSPQPFLAHLLRESAERVLVGMEPETRVSPTPLLGAFCAALARGDAPSQSLYQAQRRAWDENLHPVLWSGFMLWERR